MTRMISMVLLFATLLLGGRSVALSATDGLRLTGDGSLHALVAWDEDGSLHARRRAGATLQAGRIDARTGRWRTVEGEEAAREPLDRAAVMVDGTTHRLMLRGRTLLESDHEVLGRPVTSAAGRFVVLGRSPRGAETAALGDLWRVEVATGQTTRLTVGGGAEVSPVISPDGRRVAFLRDGDLWIIPSDRVSVAPEPERRTAAAVALASHSPPGSIRVIHVASANNCRPGVPDGRIDTIPFEDYIKRVVPHEMPPSWPLEGLKAQAVAARTYSWRYVLDPADVHYDVTDTTQHQYMCDTTDARTNQAVDETAGQHLTYAGTLIPSLFSAENSSATKENIWGHPYLKGVDDPPAFGTTRNGHGQGFSQWGGRRWADAGWSHIQILTHYYDGAKVEPPAGAADPVLLDAASRPTTDFLRGQGLWVALNASQVSRTEARTWTPNGSGGLAYGPWMADGYGGDGWQHFFDLRALPDLPIGQFRVEYRGIATALNVSQPPIPVLYFGIDRTPPTLSASLSVDGAGAASLNVAYSDGTSGMERFGWSYGGWQQEAEGTAGLPVIGDGTAWGGQALRVTPGAQAGLPIAFPAIVAPPGHYRMWFRLRTSAGLADNGRVATLRLFDDQGTPVQRGVRPLQAADFPGAGWHWFYVDIDTTDRYGGQSSSLVTPVVDWPGTLPLEIDALFLATRPGTLLGGATFTITPPERVLVYASDLAGNGRVLVCRPGGGLASPGPTPRPDAFANLTPRGFFPLFSGGITPQEGPYGCGEE